MATKTSASAAFNSYFYQQQQPAGNSKMENGESVGDLHVKMSKKIAQLTKVIKFNHLTL